MSVTDATRTPLVYSREVSALFISLWAPQGAVSDGVLVLFLQLGKGLWRHLTSAISRLTCPLATTR